MEGEGRREAVEGLFDWHRACSAQTLVTTLAATLEVAAGWVAATTGPATAARRAKRTRRWTLDRESWAVVASGARGRGDRQEVTADSTAGESTWIGVTGSWTTTAAVGVGRSGGLEEEDLSLGAAVPLAGSKQWGIRGGAHRVKRRSSAGVLRLRYRRRHAARMRGRRRRRERRRLQSSRVHAAGSSRGGESRT